MRRVGLGPSVLMRDCCCRRCCMCSRWRSSCTCWAEATADCEVGRDGGRSLSATPRGAWAGSAPLASSPSSAASSARETIEGAFDHGPSMLGTGGGGTGGAGGAGGAAAAILRPGVSSSSSPSTSWVITAARGDKRPPLLPLSLLLHHHVLFLSRFPCPRHSCSDGTCRPAACPPGGRALCAAVSNSPRSCSPAASRRRECQRAEIARRWTQRAEIVPRVRGAATGEGARRRVAASYELRRRLAIGGGRSEPRVAIRWRQLYGRLGAWKLGDDRRRRRRSAHDACPVPKIPHQPRRRGPRAQHRLDSIEIMSERRCVRAVRPYRPYAAAHGKPPASW